MFEAIRPKYEYIYSPVIGLYFKSIYDVITVTMVTPQQWEKDSKITVFANYLQN